MIRLLRRVLGLVALAAAAWWLGEAIVSRGSRRRQIEYGIADWGAHYGVRLTPLSAAERAAAVELERAALGGW